MSHALAPKKYFQHASFSYDPRLVNAQVQTAAGMKFGVYGSYDNALGRALIEKALGKRVFTLAADPDPEIARFQLDAGLP